MESRRAALDVEATTAESLAAEAAVGFLGAMMVAVSVSAEAVATLVLVVPAVLMVSLPKPHHLTQIEWLTQS